MILAVSRSTVLSFYWAVNFTWGYCPYFVVTMTKRKSLVKTELWKKQNKLEQYANFRKKYLFCKWLTSAERERVVLHGNFETYLSHVFLFSCKVTVSMSVCSLQKLFSHENLHINVCSKTRSIQLMCDLIFLWKLAVTTVLDFSWYHSFCVI